MPCIHLPKHCLSIFPSAGCPARGPTFSYHLFAKPQMCTVLGEQPWLCQIPYHLSAREQPLCKRQVRKPQREVSKSGCRHLVLANQFFLNSKPRAMQLFLCPWEEGTRPWTSEVFQQNIYTRPSAVCQSATWPDRH